VTTFAGRADAAGAADGPLATARFIAPSGLAVDSRGDLYVADSGTFTIRRIANGAVTTISGVSGTAGAIDGRPAGFAEPAGLAITPADDFLFIADRGNHAVRLRYPGDATLGFVITIGGALTQRGMADGLYEVSRFNAPSAVAADPRGRLYVADSGNHRVRKVTTVPGYVGYYTSETFAGGGEGMADGPRIQAQFRAPAGVAVDGEEVVYVADSGNQTIRKIANGVVTTLAGSPGARGSDDGYGAAARFDTPTAMALDARGNLYVCDSGNQTIRKVSPSGLVTTVAGLAGSEGASDGTGAAARFSTPSAIAIDANGTIYVADRGNHRVVVATVTSAAAAAGPRRRVAR
jgi:sugar lactone lactonase YvrE